jgi:hypothetical protein
VCLPRTFTVRGLFTRRSFSVGGPISPPRLNVILLTNFPPPVKLI